MRLYYTEIFRHKIEIFYIIFYLTFLLLFAFLIDIFGILNATKFIFGLCIASIFLYFTFRKNIYGLWFLLTLFYFIPYSSPDYLARIGEKPYFSLFKRFNSTFCLWDVLIFSLAGLILIKKLVKRDLKFIGIQYKEIRWYVYLMAFAFINGFLHVSGSFLSYGPTESLRPIIAFMPFFYFITVYLLTVNTVTSKSDLDKTLNFIWVLTLLLICHSIYRLLGILTGRIDALMMFGLPMILYDQMTFLYYPIFLYTAMIFLKVKSKKKNFLIAFSLFLIILSGTRRYFYLILIFGFIITLFLVYKIKEINLKIIFKKIFKIITVLFIVFLMLMILIPSFAKGVYDSIKSLYFISEYGLSQGGGIRINEILNMFLNMNQRKYSYIIGFGLGTRWEAIKESSYTSFFELDFGKEEINKGNNWWPQFHLPYISLLYVYGILGFIIVLIIISMFLKRSIYFVKSGNNKYYQAQLIAITAYLTTSMFFLGDSCDPTLAIFCGVLYGLLVSINKFVVQNLN